METNKRTIKGEISARDLRKYLDEGLESVKRSGAGICLKFKSKKDGNKL